MNIGKLIVSDNSLQPFFSTLVQRALIALLSYFGATGFLADDDVAKIASGLVAFALIVFGALKSYRENEKKKAVEPLVSDRVMTTASKERANG